MEETIQDIAEKIRKGEIDCNNQSLFFAIIAKGLMLELKNNIRIRDIEVPHYILNTGDETMVLENKGYDHSKEPLELTNENNIYTVCPRCAIEPKGISLMTDQLTNPYTNGLFQWETEENVYTFSGEFRRMPLKMTFSLTYLADSYSDVLALVQQIVTKLIFIRTFNVTYMGQTIRCSYVLPESYDQEYMVDFSGNTTDDRRRKINMDLEVETYIPIYNEKTVIPGDQYIRKFEYSPMTPQENLDPKDDKLAKNNI